jgi:hypothetical protein
VVVEKQPDDDPPALCEPYGVLTLPLFLLAVEMVVEGTSNYKQRNNEKISE